MFEHVIEGCQCKGKRCPGCDAKLCHGKFSPDKYASSGLRSRCKACNCKGVSAYYQEHAEERRAYSRNYGMSHPEKIQQNNQMYYQENREQEIARAMAYYTAHPEQKQKHRKWLEKNAEAVKAYSAKYAQEHAEEIEAYRNSSRYRVIRRAITNRRRTRVTQAGGSYSADEWEALKAQYDYTCLCCGKREPDIQLEADHVIPVIKGGSSNIENIQPLCPLCNQRKGRKTTDYRPRLERCIG